MYLTYEEYTEMGGTLEQAAFTDLEYEARSYIDWITFSRLKKMIARGQEIPDEVKECMYHIIKLALDKLMALQVPGENSGSQTGITAGIASQSNDGVSISYNTLSAKDLLESSEKEMTQAIQRYLSEVRDDLGHRLLYRGLYPNE